MVTEVLEDEIIRQVPASWRMFERPFLRHVSTNGGMMAILEEGELSLSVSLTEEVIERESELASDAFSVVFFSPSVLWRS
jgi:hypothetical protein